MDKLLNDIKSFFPHFEVTINDLHSPSQIFVRDFYIRALIELGGDDENVRKVQLSQNEVDPMEVEILPEINLVTAIRFAFPFIDVGLLDLLNPIQKRTCHHIRNILNFLSHADICVTKLNPEMAAYKELNEKLSRIKMLKDKCAQESNDLALENNALMSSKKEILDKIEKIKQDRTTAGQKLEELNTKRNKVQQLKREQVTVNQCLDQELRAKSKKVEELNSELVEHPEIDQHNLKEKEDYLGKLMNTRLQLHAKIKQKKNQKLVLKASVEKINEILLPTCTAVVAKIKQDRGCEEEVMNQEKDIKSKLTIKQTLLKKLQDCKNNLDTEEKRKMTLEAEWQQEEEVVIKKMDESNRNYSEELSKFKAAKKTCGMAKKKLDEANKRIEEIKKELEENENMFKELMSLMSEKEEEEEEKIKTIANQIKIREKQFNDLKNKFMQL